jgi:hypothetical protein
MVSSGVTIKCRLTILNLYIFLLLLFFPRETLEEKHVFSTALCD